MLWIFELLEPFLYNTKWEKIDVMSKTTSWKREGYNVV
jgi:hypothetical protein